MNGCVMCGGVDAEIPVGDRWLCRPDAERLVWRLNEIAAVAETCGVTLDQLRSGLLR